MQESRMEITRRHCHITAKSTSLWKAQFYRLIIAYDSDHLFNRQENGFWNCSPKVTTGGISPAGVILISVLVWKKKGICPSPPKKYYFPRKNSSPPSDHKGLKPLWNALCRINRGALTTQVQSICMRSVILVKNVIGQTRRRLNGGVEALGRLW